MLRLLPSVFYLLLSVCFFSANSNPLTSNATVPVDLPPVVAPTAAQVVNSPQNKNESSKTNGIVHTYLLTLFYYKNTQVYIYNPTTNNDENLHDPEKWIFFYVPVMLPTTGDEPWIWTAGNETRIKLMLGNEEIDQLARKAVMNKFDSALVKNYSKFWDIAPLMIDSLSAYVIGGDTSPVVGVQHYHAIHPNTLTMTMRFQCATNELATDVVRGILRGDYEIEVSLYFAEFKQVKTNYVSITADQLKSISSKTSADGGNTDAQYIHRNQASKFVGHYVTNVKKMVYLEDPNTNTSALDIQDTFTSLLQQGMDSAKQETLKADLYGQVWSSADLNPDQITSEINKLFTKNASESELHSSSDKLYSVDKEHAESLSKSSSKEGGAGVSFLGISVGAKGGSSSSTSSSFYDKLAQTDHEKYSQDDIKKMLNEQQADFEWNGQKFIPKSFQVYKLSDLTNRLQVAIIAKQLTIDKNRGAIIRTINTMNIPIGNTSSLIEAAPPFLIGTIQLYAGAAYPPVPWLLCNGATVSRTQYRRLFTVLGQRYGPGDGNSTFNLPDLRGRVPVGVDDLRIRVSGAYQTGVGGGMSTHQITSNQMPVHSHSPGTLSTATSGNHIHDIYDPGHNHGGETGKSPYSQGTMTFHTSQGGKGNDHGVHSHTIYRGLTGISVQSAGAHSHTLSGETGSVGKSEQFSLMPPYQTVNYIIYADEQDE